MRNEQRRPGGGGAAAVVLADRSQFTISYTGCHAPEERRLAIKLHSGSSPGSGYARAWPTLLPSWPGSGGGHHEPGNPP
jgi:hypothetical protein